MLEEAQCRQGPARRRVHRHIGDFTLFWLGVYPETAESRRKQTKDSLINYRDQGKRNYLLASRLPADESSAPDDVMERLSDSFRTLRLRPRRSPQAMGRTRRQWRHANSVGVKTD